MFPVDHINLLECAVTYKFVVICITTYEAELVKYCPLAGLPSPPQTPSYTVQQYGRDSVTLTVQWQPPQYDGGASVNYTITVSPGLSPVTISGTSVAVTVSYNVMHTVSVVATNCIGNSSAMITIPVVGMLSCVVFMHTQPAVFAYRTVNL